MLTGTYERNLDAKGRLSLPAAIRSELSESVYVLPAPDVDALYVFSKDEFTEWVMGLFKDRGGFNSRKRADQSLMRRITSKAKPMVIDAASRIGLPEELRAKAGLDHEVTVVGNWDHLEIWDRATWDAAEAEEDGDDMADLFFDE